jgi:DNA-binding XRE family transcriptional regulator
MIPCHIVHPDQTSVGIADLGYDAAFGDAPTLGADPDGDRTDHGLSQRVLAERLGVSQPRAVEVESGEKNPQVDTLVKIAAATGPEFAIDIAPVGREPKLIGKATKNGHARAYAGASVLVASR